MLRRILDHLHRDLRHAIVGLRRSPGFTATVVLTLGLGIGANVAMFTVVDRLLFRPLSHLEDPATVHRVYWQTLERGTFRTASSIQYTRFLDLSRWSTSFSSLAGFSERDLQVGDGDRAMERRVGVVSGTFFGFFDAKPALGRFLAPADDRTPRGADVAVLSYPFWQAQFGGRNVIGDPIQVGNVRATIVGVAPEGFAGVNDANPPVVYLPITTYAASAGTDDAKTYYTAYHWGWMHVLVRRKPGVSLEQANADATQAFRRSWEASRVLESRLPPVAAVEPRAVVGSVRPGAGPDPSLEARTALWVMIVAAIVLAIALANVANLVLARALRRRRETAVRIALGVSRGRLAMQSITEGLVLALLSAGMSLLVAQWAGAAIRSLLVSARGVPLPVLTDWRTLAVTAIIAIVAGTLVGLVPVTLPDRGDVARTLRGGARGGSIDGARLRASFLVVQGALSVVLLVGAGLFVKSLAAVETMRMGYDAEPVMLLNRVIRGVWPGDSVVRSITDPLVAEAQSLPMVESAAWVSSAPFVSTSSTSLFVTGIDSVAKIGNFTYQATTADYFRTMGTRILQGRGFDPGDRFGSPLVSVVSESMARALWPGKDPLGQCFRIRADTMPCTTVVGVAEDMVQRDLLGTQRFHYYLPLDQFRRTHGIGLVVRLRGDPAVEGERVRQALQRVMPGWAYLTGLPLRDVVSGERRAWRLGATMFAIFGVLAIVVAAIGLYGVIGYGVTQRSHELGVRVALGARQPDIVRLVTGQSLRFAGAGVIAGMAIALGAGRWIQPLLFRQSATDPAVYAAVGLAMLAVALIASAAPAWRAARTDPNVALRSE